MPTQRRLANAIRALAMDAVQQANSGHPGMPMGMADAATALFTKHLKFDPADPKWPDRDRFVLSAGHGSMLLYSLLYLTGYDRPTIEDIKNFRQLHSPAAGHPESYELAGIEATTGPLGQGFANAVGMAIAERHLNAIYGDDLVDHRTYVICGDGDLMEGINLEAAGIASNLKLGRLIVLWDDNRITIDGSTDLSRNEDVLGRFEAMGWQTFECDGMDSAKVSKAIEEAVEEEQRPSLIRCRTIIGFGAPNKQGTSATHGSPLGADEIAAARKELGWDSPPFVIPEDVLQAWRDAGGRGGKDRDEWLKRLNASGEKAAFLDRIDGKLDDSWLKPLVDKLVADKPTVATRKASEMALDAINAVNASTIGGSADLTPSNNTQTPGLSVLDSSNYAGRYIHYGIREFGMAAAMNGMALHGGVMPYGGTFLVFSDYSRGAIRLGAIESAHVVHVMTHDSIGLGEDGPTHQPIEQLQSLRAMPILRVYRPADAVETAECWAIALAAKGPSLLALSRQNLPALRTSASENLSAKGAYRLKEAEAERKVILIGTGSEVSLAVEVAKKLEAQGVGADVVSMPCTEAFDAQDEDYRNNILPDVSNKDLLRVSIEAGTTFGWERYTGLHGLRFGIDRFGASAPAEALYEYFGLTPDKITARVVDHLNQNIRKPS
nr:transketolase [uncultured Sphingomonas sp.]